VDGDAFLSMFRARDTYPPLDGNVSAARSWTVLVGIVLANQGHAEDFSIQPLTRLDCDRAEMAWDENANVCVANSVETPN
jgi:hypothetical protein